MIELNEELRLAVQANRAGPIRLIDPTTNETFVLVRAAEYDRLKAGEYDTDGWTDEEMDLLAQEDADRLGWEGMEVYQDDRP
jgi:hypothetical protein